ncbi:MAG: 4-(cytidine 5'-diphospho)-2-C-methyl-D-erythritol kinase [Ahrensia sp.]
MTADRQADAVAITCDAPAKINFALHVTGQRADGYHLLYSLVVRANFGDRLQIKPAPRDQFLLSGPYAAELAAEDESRNLIIKARDMLRAQLSNCPPVSIELEKNLPIASGVGGGSADAAAALLGLQAVWQATMPAHALNALALELGADVPMCLHRHPMRVQGIGEQITPLAGVPRLSIVAVNPGVGMSTPAVFQAMSRKDNGPLSVPTQGWSDASGFTDWLGGHTRNDLFDAALTLCPAIEPVLRALEAQGAHLARMSGSGATCFGLFASDDAASQAALALKQAQQSWYVQAGTTWASDS